MMWRFRPWRWLTLAVGALVLLEFGFFALIGALDLVALLVGTIGLLLVASVVVLIVHNAWRVLDPGRLVFLSPDRRACLDIIYRADGRVTPANHCRAIGARSAPALRAAVGSWLRQTAPRDLDIRAQNLQVAAHYRGQFPELQIIGRDWMGHVRLGMVVSADAPRSGR
jgi:hypothetical protein